MFKDMYKLRAIKHEIDTIAESIQDEYYVEKDDVYFYAHNIMKRLYIIEDRVIEIFRYIYPEGLNGPIDLSEYFPKTMREYEKFLDEVRKFYGLFIVDEQKYEDQIKSVDKSVETMEAFFKIERDSQGSKKRIKLFDDIQKKITGCLDDLRRYAHGLYSVEDLSDEEEELNRAVRRLFVIDADMHFVLLDMDHSRLSKKELADLELLSNKVLDGLNVLNSAFGMDTYHKNLGVVQHNISMLLGYDPGKKKPSKVTYRGYPSDWDEI